MPVPTAALALVDDLPTVPPPTRRVVAKPVRNLNVYNSHPATGLTAEWLVSFYRAAERGIPVKQFDAFDDLIERDGHLRGLIDGRIQSVAGKDWVLLPGRENDPASARAAADLEAVLKNDLGFRDFLEHQLTAPHYGFAATNLVWDLVDGLIAPSQFVNVPHRRFASPSDTRADEIWLIAGDTRLDLVPLEPGLWAVSRYRHRNPWAAGLMRTAAWWAMFKTWSIRDWQVFADMFGLPLAIGYYEEGASQAAREALLDSVQRIGEDGYAVLSEMTEIVIKDTVRAGDASSVYPAIADRCEAQMSKLIAGSTLTTDTNGGAGSYALGAVHENRSYSLMCSDARRIEEMFVRDIGRPFVAWNGYGGAAPPRLKMQIARETSLKERAEVIVALGAGMDIDEDQIREEFSLRKPAPGRGIRFEKPEPAAPPSKGPKK